MRKERPAGGEAEMEASERTQRQADRDLERDGTGQRAETRGDKDPKTCRGENLVAERPKSYTVL